MSEFPPTNHFFTQAQDLQRQIESNILKMERAGLLEETAGDHIRVIVAEGIAASFGERYRTYPTVPRPDKLSIQRDRIPGPCVLAAQGLRRKAYIRKAKEPALSVCFGNTSPIRETTKPTSCAVNRRVSAWAVGVANASSASTSSPEKSITHESSTRPLAANVLRWDAILDSPIEQSPQIDTLHVALDAAITVKSAHVAGLPPVINNTAGIIKVEGNELDTFFGTFGPKTPPSKFITVSPPTACAGPEIDDTDDWLIDLSP